ncbi:MAG: radical SAM protein [bacterium]|nr:radical SAM protein [bacterium]
MKPYPALYKKYKIFSRFFAGRPVWCTWQVTYRCNFSCNFCDYWKCRIKPADELGLREIEAGCRTLFGMSSFMVSIGGGEPFMRPDLPEIIEIMARYHMPLLTTNGWFVTREFARRAFRAGLWGASVSIDYASEERHDESRGVEGAYRRAVDALRVLSEERCGRFQRVNLMAVLKNDNLDEMEPLIRLAARHGAYFMVQPYCSLKGGEGRFLPDRSVSAHLLALRRRHPNFISNPYFLERFDAALNGGVPACKAGRGFFNVDNFGRVAKCVEDLDHPIGSVLSDAPAALLRKLRAAWRANTCRACWYNCRGEIEALFDPRGLAKALPVILSTWSRTERAANRAR